MSLKSPSSDATSAKAVNETAAFWLARRESGVWPLSEQRRLDSWLDADTAHRVAYLRLEATWDRADQLRGHAASQQRLASDTVWKRLRRPKPKFWLGSGLAASLAFALTLTIVLQPRPVLVSTPVGGRALAPLSDGTKVDLNTDTQIRLVVNDSRRAVQLDRGEAYFDVARRPDLPFVVTAGDQTITVLGTRFSVRRMSDGAVVMVEEGRVRVADGDDERVLGVGDELIADARGMRVVRAGADRIAANLAWRTGRLVFQDVTLAEAASSFNRYNDRQIVIADPQVAGIRIGGAFQTGRVEDFAELLEDVYGLDVARRPGKIILRGPSGG